MPHSTVTMKVRINAPVTEVWRMFDDPAFTREIGGEYESEWREGAFIGWKTLDGRLQTRGTIVRIERGRLLEHTILGAGGAEDVFATVTYTFTEEDGRTTVSIREQLKQPLTDAEHEDALSGWEAALRSVKALVEAA